MANGYLGRRSIQVLALRGIAIVISFGCLTSLAADNARPCAGEIACRWPADAQQLRAAPPSDAEALINELAAREDFAVESVQRYPGGR